jgi:strictosidine synthase
VRLPQALHPAPVRHAWVLGVDHQARLVHDLQDPTASQIAVVTSVQEHDGWLYLGSLSDDAFARYPRPIRP